MPRFCNKAEYDVSYNAGMSRGEDKLNPCEPPIDASDDSESQDPTDDEFGNQYVYVAIAVLSFIAGAVAVIINYPK